ncbi:DUF1178 domain-containing protein [Sedimentitalea sp. CY04]|uniref:DUF1178 domain-containing protein n=1 Tax=Parasedimentitalea denitrificans TaxID=2211118 RepID=A0ABX0W7A2_9RHOB|nr:DUF1178 family protein [Sedimentitalea sp. CY04]NIZ61477.1 DUF1178 domain-containing protein [Sedimentitalea sp. CY04]
MIQYSLKCDDGHRFDSWFQSAAAFDKLSASGLVSCAICGTGSVEKAIMTPRVRPGRKAVSGRGEPDVATPEKADAAQASGPTEGADPVADKPSTVGALSQPATETEKAIAELRRKVEDNSDYVGKDFVTQARAMYEGDAPGRAIHGEAKLDEAKALIEEGIPVLPLPFRPNRKTN